MDLLKELRLTIYELLFKNFFKDFSDAFPPPLTTQRLSTKQYSYGKLLPILHAARKIRSEIVDSSILVQLARTEREALVDTIQEEPRFTSTMTVFRSLTVEHRRRRCDLMLRRMQVVQQNTTIV